MNTTHTLTISGQQFTAAMRYTPNCYGIASSPAWGIECLPQNGVSYISNQWFWFTSEADRAAFLAS